MDKQVIFNTVCGVMNVRPELVMQDNSIFGARKKELVEARFWSMYFMKRYTIDSLEVIGAFFNRNHATALHAIKKIDENLLVYSESRILQSNIELAFIEIRKAEAERIMKQRLELLVNEFTDKAKQIINDLTK